MSALPKSIVWLASYPKSGNTWVRFLVCNLVFGPQESAAALNELAPDIHELGSLEPPATPLLVKTHFPFGPQLPLASQTAAAIYVVRHPADVLLSNFHYARRSGAVAADEPAAFDEFVAQFLEFRGDPRWIALGMGRWDENVGSWLAQPKEFPVLALRYEDLLADAAGAAARICVLLGLSRTEAEVAAAVAGASFERLRAIEEADIRAERTGIFFKPYLRQTIESGRRFMRAGRAGEAATHLSAAQRQALTAAFGATLQAVGYA